MRVSVRVIADVVIFILDDRMTVSRDGEPFVGHVARPGIRSVSEGS